MSKVNIDSLVSALSNEKVLEALGKVIQASLEEVLSKKLETLSKAVEALQKELGSKNDQVQTLMKQNSQLKSRLQDQSQHIEKLEIYNRQDNLIIQGLPLSYAHAAASSADGSADNQQEATEHSSDTEVEFIKFCDKQLGVKLQPNDISICHRLRKSPKQNSPPVIVRFTNRKARAAVLSARKKLRNAATPMFINEHLTRPVATLFAAARKLAKNKRISQAWTKNGQLFIKELNGTLVGIDNEAELTKY